VVVLIIVNYFGDAANLFRKSIEKEIATTILRGKNVTNISNFDERLFQKEIIKGFQKTPEVIVLGSSRTLQIENSHFAGKTFFNHSVSGAVLEDYLAIIQIYKDFGLTPKEIIICLDPWILNDSHNQIRWKSLSDELGRFLGSNDQNVMQDIKSSESTLYAKLQNLVSLSYFQTSFESLINNRNSFDSVMTVDNQLATRVRDGSMVYGTTIRNTSAVKVKEEAMTFINSKLYSLEFFAELSPAYKVYLQKITDHTKQKGIKVKFVMLPYHPTVYNFIEKNSKYYRVLEAENFFEDFAIKEGLPIYGSFDPKKTGATEMHFFDGMHFNEYGIDFFMNNFLSNPAN
jgi:hypothetical protein